jgi:hypothetical protein
VIRVIPGWIKLTVLALAALVLVLLATSAAQSRRLKRLSAERRELEEDLGVLHEALLPATAPSWSRLEVSSAYRPADGAGAGGGFHDAFEIGQGEYGVLVGSVFGAGPAVLGQATALRHSMRAYLRAGFSPRHAVHLAGDALLADHEGGLASLVAAVYDRRGGKLRFCAAGVPVPLLHGVPGPAPVAAPQPSPLGMSPLTCLMESTIPLVPGAVACFYSDGLVEARMDGEVLGESRLGEIATHLEPALSADRLVDRVADLASAVPNDLAVCVLRALEDAPSGGPRADELAVLSSSAAEGQIRDFLAACGVTSVRIESTLRAAMRLVEAEGGVLVHVERSRGAAISLAALRHEHSDDVEGHPERHSAGTGLRQRA